MAYLDFLLKKPQTSGMSLPPGIAGIPQMSLPGTPGQGIAPFSTVGNAPMTGTSLYNIPIEAQPIEETTTQANPMQLSGIGGIPATSRISGASVQSTPQQGIAGQPTQPVQTGSDFGGFLRDFGQAFAGAGRGRYGMEAYGGGMPGFSEGGGKFAALTDARNQREFENQTKLQAAEEQQRQFDASQAGEMERLKMQERMRASERATDRSFQLQLAQLPKTAQSLEEGDKITLASAKSFPGVSNAVNEALILNDKTYGGGVSSMAAVSLAETIGIGKSGEKYSNYSKMKNKMMTVVLPQLKVIFGTNPTEGERASGLALAGVDPSLTPEVRRSSVLELQNMIGRNIQSNVSARGLEPYLNPNEVSAIEKAQVLPTEETQTTQSPAQKQDLNQLWNSLPG